MYKCFQRRPIRPNIQIKTFNRNRFLGRSLISFRIIVKLQTGAPKWWGSSGSFLLKTKIRRKRKIDRLLLQGKNNPNTFEKK